MEARDSFLLVILRDRLEVARELLTETGSIFVQIGDENVHLVRCVLDEVFGSENAVSAQFISAKTSSASDGAEFRGVIDYIIWYAKDTVTRSNIKTLFNSDKVAGVQGATMYDAVELSNGEQKVAYQAGRSFA